MKSERKWLWIAIGLGIILLLIYGVSRHFALQTSLTPAQSDGAVNVLVERHRALVVDHEPDTPQWKLHWDFLRRQVVVTGITAKEHGSDVLVRASFATRGDYPSAGPQSACFRMTPSPDGSWGDAGDVSVAAFFVLGTAAKE